MPAKMQMEYGSYNNISPLSQRISSLSLSSKEIDSQHYATNHRYSHDPYREFIYKNNKERRRLSSTGEGSGDSCTTTSGSSSYGEKEDGSEGRTESEETDEREEDRKPLEGHITLMERQKVESFFKGLKTEVYVSESLANLYTKKPLDVDWQLKYTGIPVIILDIGESRARDKRKIQIALAERGTSFMLWNDTIDNLSDYKVSAKSFHTMCYSQDHSMQVGFSFDTAPAAHNLWTHIETLIACPENISLSLPGKKKKKDKKRKQKAEPLPPKSHISTPCFFNHITSVDVVDARRYYSLKEYLPNGTELNSRIHEVEEI
ncbi:uncharacterized protein LOC123684309 [Harmonia axyridis]|uniref:uncharacterized protein LOC123684309 n=1 Tax=Harmonia axyridis TaxID=115357 RepID=UPI001E279500|nr:uncharacterized protein LOC123684309 [Harmonia axyridis]XP_045479475.1 uncharacterized protein LOC123684309 [Harmonia axyridis]